MTDERLLPLTLGVYGAWGSGKSRVIGMSRAVLEQDESIFCVSFDGRQFEGYEEAQAALVGTIPDVILGRRTLSQKAVDFGKQLLKREDWFRLLAGSARVWSRSPGSGSGLFLWSQFGRVSRSARMAPGKKVVEQAVDSFVILPGL